jgi:RecB family exonuclease
VDAEAVLRQLYQLYDWCHELAREQGELRDAFHREFLNLWHTKLHQLEALVAQQPELSAADVRALLLQLLERQRIPFAGEPLGGVQIMGLLETRALQFDTVYVLSMNEGQMPRSSRPDGTLLPGVRQLLGLPGPEALEAQYSYLFWRLLQGVPTAHLFSTGEANETGGGEPSRFIRQIEMDWCLDNPHVQVQHHRWQEAQLVRHSLILRPQVADVALALSNGATDEAGHPLIKMSPTALSTYLKCPLRFWFRYVQHLLPPEELTEDPDAKQFGSLVHKTLELLYAPFVGQTVEGTDLHRLMQPDTLEQALAQALEAELQQLGSADFGKMILLKEVAREMVLGTLRQDAERVPFGIEALEAFLTHRVQLPLPDGGSVTLQLNGFADRIDSLPEGVVIWDYKTGSVQAKDLKLEAPETLLKGELRGSKSPAMALQMLLYGWLWWRKTGAQPLDAGILAVRQVPAAAHALPLSFSTATLEATDQLLRDLMAEILAPNRTFDPTEDLATCTYCDYRQICQRG